MNLQRYRDTEQFSNTFPKKHEERYFYKSLRKRPFISVSLYEPPLVLFIGWQFGDFVKGRGQKH
jgi:hypothetical protein